MVTFECDAYEIEERIEELNELGWLVTISHPDGDYVCCYVDYDNKHMDIEYYEDEDECPIGSSTIYDFLDSVGLSY